MIAIPLGGISLRERSYRTHARGGEKSTPGSRCALPHRGPARGQPLLSGADQGICTGSAKSIVMAHCHEQFFLAGWVVFCWDLCARLFWDFAASGAGRRRLDRHRDRMDIAETARCRNTRRAKTRPAAGHLPPGILPLDDATDSRPWINFRGDHARRERGSPSLVPSFDNLGCTHWIGVDRDQHFALLRICRPVGANPGSNGDDGDHAIVVVFPGLYRCADCLERDQSIAGIGDATFWLTRRTFPLELPAATNGWQPTRILPRVATLPCSWLLSSRQAPVSGRTDRSRRRSNSLPEEWQRAFLSPRGPSAGVSRRGQRIGFAWECPKGRRRSNRRWPAAQGWRGAEAIAG